MQQPLWQLFLSTIMQTAQAESVSCLPALSYRHAPGPRGLGLGGEVDEGFGAVVPAPRDVVALQVHAADPAVDAVEGDLVGLASQDPGAGAGQAHAGGPPHGAARRVEEKQGMRAGRQL